MQTKLETECPHQNEWDLCHELLFQSKLLECNWWVWNWGGEGFGSIFRNLPALPNPQYAVLPLIRHPANPSGGLFAVWGTRSEVLIIGVLSTKVQSPPMITLYGWVVFWLSMIYGRLVGYNLVGHNMEAGLIWYNMGWSEEKWSSAKTSNSGRWQQK